MLSSSDDTERLLADSAASFLAGRATLARVRAARPGAPAYSPAAWRGLAGQGWLALRLPQERGGSGLGLRHAMRLTDTFGRCALPEPYVACALMPAVLAGHLPCTPAWDRITGGLVDGGYCVSVAWQGDPQVLDAGFDNVRAEGCAGDLVLDGACHGVIGASMADALLVCARLDGAPALIEVPRGAAGLVFEDHSTSDGGTVSTVRLHRVAVDSTAVLACGEAVARAMSAALAEATLATASHLVGLAAAALDITLEYLKVRVQFGKPIGSFQSLQHAAADVRIQQALAIAACGSALARFEAALGDPSTAATAAAAVAAAKARASDAALMAGRFGVQAHGAIGFAAESDIGLFLKTALRLGAWLGNGTQQRRRYEALTRASAMASSLPASVSAPAVLPSSVPTESADLTGFGANALDDESFRIRLRSWIAANYRSPLRNPLKRLAGEDARAWLRAQHRDGWRAPGLPAEDGGMGLSLRKQRIYQEELERFGIARPIDHGLRLLAPVLLRYGSAAQRAHWMPRILASEDTWCQGYSEPNAGSDLAGLRTAAVVRGDELVVNGQKIWTSLATDANMIFMLVRTSTEARKQQGITFLLVDLRTPGIRIRPIRTLASDENLCEVFFDDVVVPRANVIGEMGQGWAIAKALLGFERFSHGSPELINYAFGVLQRTGTAMGLEGSEAYRDLCARLACDVADSTALYEQVCEAALQGVDASGDASMLKLFVAELVQRIAEAASELAGQCGGLLGSAPALGLADDLEWLFMVTRPVTIYGGSSQLQRNLIATRLLGLLAG